MKRTNPIFKSVLLSVLPLFMLAACTESEDPTNLKPLELGKDAVEIGVNYSTSVDIFSGNGKYSVSSDNESIATATCADATVTITGKSQGSAVITVKDELSKNTANIQVKVSALALSADVKGVAFEDNRTFNVLNGSGSYTVTAAPSDVITVLADAADKTKFRIYGAKIGTATLTVTDTETNNVLNIPMLVCEPIDTEVGTLSVVAGDSDIVNITAGSGSYAVESTNEALAVGSVVGSVATITGVSIGTVAVNVRDVVTGNFTSVSVRVTDNKISLKFHDSGIGASQNFLINASRLYRDGVWFDINGNGNKDSGEAITLFDEDIVLAPLASDVVLYGKVTRLGRFKATEGVSFNIKEADFSKNPYIQSIELNRGMLTSINVNGCTQLEKLYISNNQNLIETLDVSTNTALKELYISFFGGTTLDVSNLANLEVFQCQESSGLTSIKFKGNTKLKEFNCVFNPTLTSITGLSECENLTFINTYGCGLSSIDLTQNKYLEKVYIGGNPYTSAISLASNQNTLTELSIYSCAMADAHVKSLLNSIPGKSKVTYLQLWGNKIESLDLSAFTSVRTIQIQHNKISATEALALVNSLPARNTGTSGSIIVADTSPDLAEGVEGNHFSKAAVDIAISKNWNVYCINGGQTIPYAGEGSE